MHGPDAWRTPVARVFIARDFRFHTGEVAAALKLGYTVLGNPQGRPVLVLHGTGGTGSGLLNASFGGQLFGPGQPLDAARHLIVLPDAIGHGASAKPSDGLRTAFPRYTYDDQVRAQHLVVTQALGLQHLSLVLGVSMGGMHAWLWGTRHPSFMDALMPMACLPAPMSGRNWMLRRLLVDAVRNDPQWADGHYAEQPAGVRAAWEFFDVATNGGTQALQNAAPQREAADRWLAARRAAPFAVDANDLLYQWEAARDYDPSDHLELVRARVLAIISADDERNPLETGIALKAIERLPNGRLMVLPASDNTKGHATVGLAALWAQECRELMDAIAELPVGTPGSSRPMAQPARST